jgi:hypothetical protein
MVRDLKRYYSLVTAYFCHYRVSTGLFFCVMIYYSGTIVALSLDDSVTATTIGGCDAWQYCPEDDSSRYDYY